MAEPATSPQTDRDLASIAEARALARRAKQAWLELAEFSQERIDAIVDAMAAAATPCAEMFARVAVEETGYGVVEDKIQKNLFSSQKVYDFIRPMKTVGVVGRHQLDDDGDARRHAGADEAPRRRGHPGDGRDGIGPRGVQRRQTGVRRRSGQRAGVHRAHSEREK